MADLSPETIALLRDGITATKDVLLEAIKIVGAAAIAAYATYRAMRLQIDAKLMEIREQNSFNARRELFALYKEQQTKHSENMFKLGEWLGNTLGQIAAGVEDEAYISLNDEIIKLGAAQLPMALRHTQAEMAQYRLTETEPYRQLEEFIDNPLKLEHGHDALTFQKNALALMKVFLCW